MRRSMLFVPGNTPKMMTSCGFFGADAVVFDLEDAVSPTEKDAARDLVRYAIGNLHLCGSESEQIKEGGYDTLSTYGIMKDVRQTYVREIIDHLELQGLLSVSDDYHTLEITPEGDEFIRSRRTLLMKRSKRAADISAVTQFSNSDGVEDPELMKRLRELRKKFADTLGVPAFVVFSDASLRVMCAKKPATKQEFLCISGVGSVKAERYGKDFVKVVSEYLNEKNS